MAAKYFSSVLVRCALIRAFELMEIMKERGRKLEIRRVLLGQKRKRTSELF